MNFFRRTIFTGFAPNITKTDFFLSVSFLLFPWKWALARKGAWIKEVEEWISNYFRVNYTVTFDSGRSALYFALKAAGVKKKDEVLIQGYTCVVVPNAIKLAGAIPIYVDTNNELNMNPSDLKKKITNKSKIIIIQHTFGKPADLKELLKIARDHNLKVIEDCAHVFGVKYNEKYLGTFGDIGMFSFGSDKPVSCVRGGALITNNYNLFQEIKNSEVNLKQTPISKVIQHLLHIQIFWIAKPLYHLKIGKLLLWISKKLGLISKTISQKEKRGAQIKSYPAKLPNALAQILFKQLNNLEIRNEHRLKIANLYDKKIKNNKITKPQKWTAKNAPLRYIIFVNNPQKLIKDAKKQGILLGNWYNRVIAPHDIDISKTGYKIGDCQNAEKQSAASVNLPTDIHITEKDALRIIKFLNNY